MTQNEGIAVAVDLTSSPQERKAEQLKKMRSDNLAKARAAAAQKREEAKAAAAAGAAEEKALGAPPLRAGLGLSAARKAQAPPGTLIGHTDRGRAIVIGRDGKPISRLGETNIDKYAFSKDEIPKGWSYQWIAETVLNEPQTAALLDFRMKQWTPVPQDRHPNKPVRQGGLVLVERPTALTQEAREEEMKEARDQVRANIEQFQPPGDLKKTGRIRKGKPVSVSADGVEPPTLELADEA